MDPSELRADIPVAEEVAYLNTGAGSPCPERVVEATCSCVTDTARHAPKGDMYSALGDVLATARNDLAEFLGADPEEIALAQSTGDGIARIAAALPLEAGDTVVRPDIEHPAGIVPWRRLQDAVGIEVEVLGTRDGRLDPDDVRAVADEADLFCLSSLTWTHGTHLPVEEVVEIAHDAGALVLVDAVQSVGQEPVNLDEWGADFAVGAGHKWLLGPWGAGFVYVRDGAEEHLQPLTASYWTVENPTGEADRLNPNARRLEVATTSPAPYAGIVEAVGVIEEVGVGTIRSRIERLTDRLKEGIPPDRLLSPREFESGLVSFAVADPEAFVERCAKRDVTVRSVPLPGGAVRASVHAFNTPGDVDALLDAADF